MVSLNNRVAMVTGGCRGIGRGIALALAKAGAPVVITYRVNQEKALQACAEAGSKGATVIAMQMFLEDRGSIEETIKKANKDLGDVSILVNNAAISQEQPFETISDADWDRMLGINLGGPFRCCQTVLPQMLDKGWGRIINIASIGGQWGGFNQVHYAAAKAGLINFTRSLARLYSARGITANAISPGLVATDMSAAELDSVAGQQKVRNIPAQRLGTPEEVGAAVVFLASDAAGYVTGQTLNLNGGMYFG